MDSMLRGFRDPGMSLHVVASYQIWVEMDLNVLRERTRLLKTCCGV